MEAWHQFLSLLYCFYRLLSKPSRARIGIGDSLLHFLWGISTSFLLLNSCTLSLGILYVPLMHASAQMGTGLILI